MTFYPWAAGEDQQRVPVTGWGPRGPAPAGQWQGRKVARFSGFQGAGNLTSPGAVLYSHLQLCIFFRTDHVRLWHLIQ